MRKLVLAIVAVLFIGAGSLFIVSCDGGSTSNRQATEQHDHMKGDSHEKSAAYACREKCEGDKTYDQQGDCPKCGMALNEMGGDDHSGHDH